MQTQEEYEKLAEHVERILQDSLKISEHAVKALQAIRLIPKLRSKTQHREFLIDILVEMGKLLKTSKDYNLRMLIDLAEHVGLGLDGKKSEKRMKEMARMKENES